MTQGYFDIALIIDAIREQEPHRTDLIEQLKNLKFRGWIRQPYVRFVSGENANQPGAEWQFKENIVLEHETEGTIVLDVLKDGRIGGIEFISQTPQW